MKHLISLLIFALSITSVAAQTITIRGKVISAEDNMPVIGATVRLNANDTTKANQAIKAVATDVNGQFSITSREKKNDVTISYLGFKSYFTDIEDGVRSVNLGTVTLTPSALGIEEVVVIAESNMAKIKGDTVQFNAASFKTNPDATAEDLLKKMPGVTTESDGTVSSQGQKIAKVYVDGKEFFDNDPALALKSLPSDAVESVQLYDDQTDAARFSGMDDGERVRSVNIVTKAGVRQSTFGRAYVGYGTDNRYSTGVGMSTFNGDHRWTVTAASNNVNNQGFSLSDIGGGGGGGRGMMRAEGVSTGSFMTNARGGINKTSNIGLNYNGTFSEKFKMNVQYSFGNINGTQNSRQEREYSTWYTNNLTRANSLDNRHNFSARIEWKPNAKNRINFNPRVSYGLNQGMSGDESENLNPTHDITNNASQSAYSRKYENYSMGADLWWQHAFAKPGRTMSLGGQVSANKSNGNYLQESLITNRIGDVLPVIMDTSVINRIGNLSASGYSLTGSFTYNEPISQRSKLSANYNINYNRTMADQKGLNWDDIVREYALLDTATTNYLNRNYTTQTVGLAYSYVNGKKITLNFGVDYLFASQNNDQTQLWSGPVNSQFFFKALQPSFRLRMTPGVGHSLNADLRMYSGFPSITQLQDVLDVTNPTNVSKGNPDLEQSSTTMFSLRYNFANTAKNTNFNVMIMGSQSDNNISRHTSQLAADTTINGTLLNRNTTFTTYTNLNGAMSAFMFATYGFGIKPIKSNMNVSLNYRYSRQPSMQNNTKLLTAGNSIGLSFSLTSNISEKIDFTFRYDPSVSLNDVATEKGSASNIRNLGFNRYITHNFSGFFNIYLTKNLFINADASWRNNFGTTEGSSQHYTLVNAAVGYKFLKKRQAEFKVQAYDIFNQNRSYYQTTSESYIQSTTNYGILKRYFMFSFMYKFDTRKNPPAETNNSNNRRMPMGGMMRH